MSGQPIEILLIEDNPGDIRFAQEALKDYRVQNHLRVVEDGEEALLYLRRQGRYAGVNIPDLVLIDMNLPKVDGAEILGEMRLDPVLREVPVAVLTVSRDDRERLRKFGLPDACFVMKPLTLERYLEAVRCFPQLGISIVRVPPRP